MRDSELRILPLAEIEAPDEEFWEWASCQEEDVPDRNLLFQFAEDRTTEQSESRMRSAAALPVWLGICNGRVRDNRGSLAAHLPR